GKADTWYSGEAGKTEHGIPFLGLIAIIGNGRKTILIDYKYVQKVDGIKMTELARNMLNKLVRKMERNRISTDGWRVSTDSAYVNKELFDFTEEKGMVVCSTCKGNWNTEAISKGLQFSLIPKKLNLLKEFVEERNWKQSQQEPGLEYFRLEATHHLFGDIVLLFFRKNGEKTEMALSTDIKMKGISIFRTSKRRWKHERYHWDFKQIIKGDEIHNQIPLRFEILSVLRHFCLRFVTAMKRKMKTTAYKVSLIFQQNREAILKRFSTLINFKEGVVQQIMPDKCLLRYLRK
ncbi:hypothetical protein ACFL35_19485, partial [Candidatus Riflebacteria bacterium]